MFRRYRQRRGPYAMAAPSPAPSIIRSLILLALVGVVLYFTGRWVLWMFGGWEQLQRSAVQMQVEGRSTVNVSLEGGLLQRAEDSIKLYPGDRVTTGGNGHSLLTFFDGTIARTDVQSDLSITESSEGEETGVIDIELPQGALWVRTPDLTTFSGAISRTIRLPAYAVTLVSDTEVVLEQDKILVFSADGQGITVQMNDIQEPIIIGEGQQFEIPEGDVTGDMYRYRSAIEPLAVQREFIEQSRAIRIAAAVTGSGASVASPDDSMLTVTAPADKTVTTNATVRVQGTIAPRVERVRVNGYDATINRDAGSFSQELTLKETGDTAITIEALDARGIVLATETRSVQRGSQEIAQPVITSPAKSGETYRTSNTEFAIAGTVPAGAAGVMVNDYKLQLFRAGDTTWSYLASTALNNLKSGTNVYDVYALDAAGNKSQPVRITILLEAGAEGVVSGSTPTGTSTSSAAAVSETTLPNNSPLMPGTINVTGPTAGTSHTATGSEFLLEGTVPTATASVWVNGYRLQLYTPGKAYWNYIANTQFGTLKTGANLYRITARNDKNEILDTFEYTATYNR